jgi:hypothetical protein
VWGGGGGGGTPAPPVLGCPRWGAPPVMGGPPHSFLTELGRLVVAAACFVGLLQAGHAVKERSYPGMLAARGSFKAHQNFISSVPLAWPEEDATAGWQTCGVSSETRNQNAKALTPPPYRV